MPRLSAPFARGLLLAPTLALVLPGCRKLEPAPKELDRLFPWFFSEIDQAEPEQLAEGFRNLHAAADGDTLEDTQDGTLSRLDEDALGTAEVEDPELGRAAGVYMLRPLKCSMAQLEKVLYHDDQKELYPDAYETYGRSFVTDKPAYVRGDEDLLRWEVDYTATILGKSYSSEVHGTLRRVPVIDGDQSPFGQNLVARAYIPAPAVFEKDGTSLDQDYQIEMYHKIGDGLVLHAYAIWRQADFGAGIDSESEGAQRLLLNNLAKWDEETEALCAEGRP